MENNRFNQLLQRLDILSKRHEEFSKEINNLRFEIESLMSEQETAAVSIEEIEKEEKPILKETYYTQNIVEKKEESYTGYSPKEVSPEIKINEKSNIEKFIGENLFSKIGIIITIIGVGIGAKYSIEHDLISPLTRIIFGYVMGLGLIGFGIKLKKNYENLSAVLISGAMAILYFITYSAYSFYALIPQTLTFVLMVFFTAFTVLAAITYNRQVIAHIGLVGAYAVPFLLSEGSGKVAILFSYMTIINIGILIISFKKYWKALYYTSFCFTWIIYWVWFLLSYKISAHFEIALIFLSIFFLIFYLTFISYKLSKNKIFEISDVILVLINSFIFYGLGYAILSNHNTGEHLLGLFTLINAIVHFTISLIIYRQKLVDKNLLYLISGLVLVFITLTIPDQLDGNWVTLLWAGEASLLFWIGRTKNIAIYEKISYPLMILGLLSIIHDWNMNYGTYLIDKPETRITPVFNINFLSSLLFSGAFSFMTYIQFKKEHHRPENNYIKTISYIIPVILLISLYFMCRIEIANYWNQLYTESAITTHTGDQEFTTWNPNILSFKTIWIINFSILFFSILSFVNLKKIKTPTLTFINLIINMVMVFIFLIQGLYVLSELRETYVNQSSADYYHKGDINLGLRYISFAFLIPLYIVSNRLVKQEFMKKEFKIPFEIFLMISCLWLASSELIHWLDIANSTQIYKLGLSILWGLYSFTLIILGMWKRKKHFRIGAFLLFGITLIKLFFYDISHLDTISKTIVFVSLGILLLVISFLYNKYKRNLYDEPEN